MTQASISAPHPPEIGAAASHRPRRIFIIGGPCSGKTHLAARLAPRLGLPNISLDYVAFQVLRDTAPSNEISQHDRLANAAATLAAGDAWIAEGNYLGWTGPFLDAAAVIVWKQVRWPVAIYRVFRRYAGQRLRGQRDHPGAVNLLGFCLYTFAFYRAWDGAANIETMAATLEPYSQKVFVCAGDRDVRRLIETLEAEPAWR